MSGRVAAVAPAPEPGDDGIPAGKRAQTKERNRGAILAAAREVFADIGYGAATVRDIVRGTELATGTFYNYFPDKESVLRAMAEDDAEGLRARVREGRARAATLEQFVEGGFRGYFSYIAEDPSYFELMRRNAGTIRTLLDEPALGAGVSELLDDLRDAIDRGEMPDVDADYMTAAMVGVAFEVGTRMVERQPVDVDGATRFATELFLGGIERMAPGRGGR